MQEKTKTTVALIAAVLLLLDQATKHFFADSVSAYCNPVGPWGVSVDNKALIAVMVMVLAGVGYLFLTGFFRDSSTSPARNASRNDAGGLGMTICRGVSCHMAFALLFAGGVSNLLDRIFFGCVRDFSLIPWFPAFNLADVYLTIGVGIFLFAFSLRKKSP